jgi:pimeloyl-ACP methyl ester carboxylesterase
MPIVKANGLSFNYTQQGSGAPLVLIPYLAADNACYAFQVGEYAKHFTCISIDLRDTGESDKPDVAYTTKVLADDVAAITAALGIEKFHVAGLSLGAAVSMWLGVSYPQRVKSLSLHAGWQKSDPFLRSVIESFQIAARGLDNVTETIIRAMFPWCFTPELYANKPDYMEQLAGFVRSRPVQPLASFIRQSNAVLAHDVESELGNITAPTLITVGSEDQLTSKRFTTKMKEAIKKADVIEFDACAHAPIYENVEEFNQKTLAFLLKQER